MTPPADCAAMDPATSTELMKLEREVADRHVGHFPWASAFWGLANPVVWLALWPLVFMGYLPLWPAS